MNGNIVNFKDFNYNFLLERYLSRETTIFVKIDDVRQ